MPIVSSGVLFSSMGRHVSSPLYIKPLAHVYTEFDGKRQVTFIECHSIFACIGEVLSGLELYTMLALFFLRWIVLLLL